MMDTLKKIQKETSVDTQKLSLEDFRRYERY